MALHASAHLRTPPASAKTALRFPSPARAPGVGRHGQAQQAATAAAQATSRVISGFGQVAARLGMSGFFGGAPAGSKPAGTQKAQAVAAADASLRAGNLHYHHIVSNVSISGATHPFCSYSGGGHTTQAPSGYKADLAMQMLDSAFIKRRQRARHRTAVGERAHLSASLPCARSRQQRMRLYQTSPGRTAIIARSLRPCTGRRLPTMVIRIWPAPRLAAPAYTLPAHMPMLKQLAAARPAVSGRAAPQCVSPSNWVREGPSSRRRHGALAVYSSSYRACHWAA